MSYIPPQKRKIAIDTRKKILLNQEIANGWCSFNKSDESFIFNLSFDSLNKKKQLGKYEHFIDFCANTIRTFGLSKDVCKAYPIDNLSQEEKKYFKENVEKYVEKFQKKLEKKSDNNGLQYVSDDVIYQINESIIDETMKDKKYNIQSDATIYQILIDRVKQLKVCFEKSKAAKLETPSRIIKTNEEENYYQKEAVREEEFLNEIKQYITNNNIVKPDERLFYKLSPDEKKRTAIGFMSDRIQWGIKNFYAFEHKPLNQILDDLFENIEKEPRIIKILMTFLPLDLFNNEQDKPSLQRDKLHRFLESKGKEQLMNIQQYRLGLGEDLYSDNEQFLSNFHQLWSTYSLIFDMNNQCSKYVDYNIYLNLFCIYMFGRSNHKVFPISFNLSSNTNYGLFDSETESYSFRNRKPLNSDILFNSDSSIKFLGLQLMKYQKNGKVNVLPLFVFIDLQYEEKIKTNREDSDDSELYSIYNLQRFKTFICNSSFFLVENGEIAPTINITHHELYNILYYKMRPYIMNGDKKVLYFTMRNRDDPELNELISKLKMEEVFILKKRYPNIPGPRRLSIINLDELKILISNGFDPSWIKESSKYPEKGFLICNQEIPNIQGMTGGMRKIKSKKILKTFKNKAHKISKNSRKKKKLIKNNIYS